MSFRTGERENGTIYRYPIDSGQFNHSIGTENLSVVKMPPVEVEQEEDIGISDSELRLKVENELESLKRNYPKKDTISFKSQSMLEKIRWLENILEVPHCSISSLIRGG